MNSVWDCTAAVPPNQARCPMPLGSGVNPGSLGSNTCCCQLRESNQLPCASVLQTPVGGVPPNSARSALKRDGESALEALNSIVPTILSLDPAGSAPVPSTHAVANGGSA